RAGEDARRRRLSTASRPGEQIGVIDAAGRQRSGERFGDTLLPDHFGEGGWSVLAVESHAKRLPRRADEPLPGEAAPTTDQSHCAAWHSSGTPTTIFSAESRNSNTGSRRWSAL